MAWLTIDNPPMNQLDAPNRAALLAELDRLAIQAGGAGAPGAAGAYGGEPVRVLVLTGAGARSFCAGNDLRELAALPEDEVEAFATEWDELYRRLREFPCPVIARVRGYALGGGFEIMLSCDLRVAADSARMGCTAANLGLVTSTHSLVRHLGEPLAKELFFTARHLAADEAQALGLVNRVVPAAGLDRAVEELAAEIARRPAGALRVGKGLMNRALDLDRAQHDRLQRANFTQLFRTREHRAAVQEFRSRRRGP